MSGTPRIQARRVCAALLSLTLATTVVGACATGAIRDSAARTARPATPRAAKSDHPGVDVSAPGGGYIAQPDPKRPGKYLWKLWTGPFSFQSPAGQVGQREVTGALHNITAILFQNGVASAQMRAPTATGDYAHAVVVAGGGVTLRSLAEKGTSLRADTVTWYARQNKVIAAGHVRYVNGRSGMTIQAPAVVCDTVLQTIRSARPGEMTIPMSALGKGSTH